MRITYDKGADALYVKIGEGMFASNKKIGSDTIIDLNGHGKLIGIELLSASKRAPAKELEDVGTKALA